MADGQVPSTGDPTAPPALSVSLKRILAFGFATAIVLSLFAVPSYHARLGFSPQFALAVWRQVVLFGLLTIPFCAFLYLSRLGPRDSAAGNDAVFFGVIAAFSLIALATPGLSAAPGILPWLWAALGSLYLTHTAPAFLGQGWLVLALRNRPNSPPDRLDARAALAVLFVAVSLMGRRSTDWMLKSRVRIGCGA